MAGDCYEANGNFIITKMNDKSFKLCHGVAILATDNKPFGHCWIEKSNSLVMDFSNGKKLALPKKKYYDLGKIPVKGYKVHSYTGTEAAKKMVDTGHWGPWDSQSPR
jgi:hypothetical protein|tara:strand:+ start:130 stop:450 length:321 start_codon:yes stop_codon:yes gene_type:complete